MDKLIICFLRISSAHSILYARYILESTAPVALKKDFILITCKIFIRVTIYCVGNELI